MDDLRYALRQLARSPGFTAVAVLTLALCIGANSAVFSVIQAILLKPYPWPDSGRLVYLDNTYPLMGLSDAGVSIPDYLDRRGIPGVEDSAMYTGASLNLAGKDEPEMIAALRVTPSLFSTLRSSASLGRVFSEDDAKPDAPATIVLSHALWTNNFGGDASIVGRQVRMNDRPVTVVGVMPEGFYFPSPQIQAWIPFVFTPAERTDSERGHEYSQMIARLVPGRPLASVQRGLDRIQAQNAQRQPQARAFWRTSGFGGLAAGYLEHNVDSIRRMLWLVQAAVGAALLIGCANVAGLLLARAVGREKELAIRTALGASRVRLARMLITESLVLFLSGGLLGTVVAVWSLDLLHWVGLSELPRGYGVQLDSTVLAVTLASAMLTGLAFGSLPAWSASRNNPSASLKEAGARGSSGRRTQRLRSALVASQIALAVMLVATAGLLIKSFVRLQRVDPGFVPGGAIAFQVVLPAGKYDTPETIVAFHDAVVARLAAAPGVLAAGATNFLPFSNNYNSASYSSPDIVQPAGSPPPHALIASADPGYLRALGLTLLRGRWFEDSDTAKSQRVVVVDRVMVDRYWKGQEALGKRIFHDSVPCIVVGVVATVKHGALDEKSEKETLYFPFAQSEQSNIVFVARTMGNPDTLAASVRDVVHAVDPSQPVFDLLSMNQRVENAAQPRRAPMVLLTVFGGLAAVLAMLGIYGILAYSVAQRTTEFGVRMALGATPGDIAGLVLRMGFVLVAVGIAVGIAGYLAISQLVAALLFGVGSTDPVTLAVAPLVLALIAACACLVPAMRATRVEPISALRQD